MSKAVSSCILVVSIGLWLALSFLRPELLGVGNTFLQDFLDTDFINLMGVLVTITLASTANIHIELRKMENIAGREFLTETRRRVRISAFALLWLFVASVVAVVGKPLVPQTDEAISLMNGLSLIILIIGILVIADITKLAFRVSPSDLKK